MCPVHGNGEFPSLSGDSDGSGSHGQGRRGDILTTEAVNDGTSHYNDSTVSMGILLNQNEKRCLTNIESRREELDKGQRLCEVFRLLHFGAERQDSDVTTVRDC